MVRSSTLTTGGGGFGGGIDGEGRGFGLGTTAGGTGAAMGVVAAAFLFCASRSLATLAALRMACFGSPVATASWSDSSETHPSGERMADQMALAKACRASCDNTTFGFCLGCPGMWGWELTVVV